MAGDRKMNYLKRIADIQLIEKLEAFGGVLIVGPKVAEKLQLQSKKRKALLSFKMKTSAKTICS